MLTNDQIAWLLSAGKTSIFVVGTVVLATKASASVKLLADTRKTVWK